MPRLVPFKLAAACGLALCLVLASTGVAAAQQVPAKLRVVAGQKVLADAHMRTGTTNVPTSRAATCFGPESVGSGKAVRVAGPTPLGLLAQGARRSKRLRPLLVTDAFSFGLDLCAIGGIEPRGEGFWQLRVNHVASQVGGDAVRLKRGDEVLWYLSPGFESSVSELWLNAPRTARPGRPFRVRVLALDEAGKRTPLAGARVSGAARRTNARGFTLVTLRRSTRLIARRGGYIPSNRDAVCVGPRCARG